MQLLDRTQAYRETGYLVVDRLIRQSKLDEIRNGLAAIANGEVTTFPTADVELEPGAKEQSLSTVRKLNRCAENDALFRELAADAAILDIVQSLIGPDIKLFGSQCFMKPPGGVEKPYHQDSAYFPIEPFDLVTCWIALDDVTVDNGCMWVIPGSHRNGILDHSQAWMVGNRRDKQVPGDKLDLNREVPIVMSAGSCSFHHSVLLHRSGPNRTDRPRRGLAVHYMSARSKWTDITRPKPEYLLLRGREFEGCV